MLASKVVLKSFPPCILMTTKVHFVFEPLEWAVRSIFRGVSSNRKFELFGDGCDPSPRKYWGYTVLHFTIPKIQIQIQLNGKFSGHEKLGNSSFC